MEPGGRPPAGPAASGTGWVLVCDDTASIRLLMRINLELAGFEVLEAGDGQAALDLLDRNPDRLPAVVLLDAQMAPLRRVGSGRGDPRGPDPRAPADRHGHGRACSSRRRSGRSRPASTPSWPSRSSPEDLVDLVSELAVSGRPHGPALGWTPCAHTRPGRCTPRATAARRGCRSPRRQRAGPVRCGRRPSGAARDGALTVGGVAVHDLAREFGTPAYVLDEADFRARAREFRDTFAEVFADLGGGADVYYAGKAFLCTEVARWIRDEGLRLDVCTGGELAVAHAGRHARASGSACTATTSRVAEIEQALALRRGPDRRRLLRRDRAASPTSPAGSASSRRSWSGSPSASRRTPTSSSRPPTRTRSSASRSAGGDAAEAVAPHPRRGPTRSSCSGCTATSARRSSTRPASRCPPGGCSACTRRSPASTASSCPSSTSAAASASPTRPSTTRCRRRDLGGRHGRDRRPRVPGRRRRRAADLDRARPGHRRPEHLHPLRGRHRQGGRPRRRRRARLRLRRRRDERQHPHRPLRRRLLLHPGQPASAGAARCSPASSASTARAATSSSRTSSCPATSRAGDLLAVPGTGAYCRRLASQYNHMPRPPVVAVRDGRARVIVRRETIDDLLALDVG